MNTYYGEVTVGLLKNGSSVAHRKQMGTYGYIPILFLFLFMSACFALVISAGQVCQASSPDVVLVSGDSSPANEELLQKTRSLQMPFIANSGQVDEQVRFYAKTFGGTVFVTKGGDIMYTFPVFEKAKPGRHEEPPLISMNRLNGLNKFSLINVFYAYLNSLNPIAHSVALKETIVGARAGELTGEQPAVTTVNYFTGNDKSKWKPNVPTFNIINMGEVCTGIELRLKAYGDNVEKLFCVKPGASPAFIKVQLDGGKSLQINHDGQLEADTELGMVKFTRPIAYQEIEGERVEVPVEYSIRDAEEQGGTGEPETQNLKLAYGFTVASYDKTKDLIIDPLLESTYLGGSGSDFCKSLALDASGNVYVTGSTQSTNFPITIGAYDVPFNGADDVFISKLNRGLTNLLASTYLGGSGSDYGNSLVIDTSGNVYVAGLTQSANFPVTSGAYNTSYKGGDGDVFVSKLDSGLTNLLASTYLGGTNSDYGNALAIDTSGNVYVTGLTRSTNFPTTSGAYDTSFNSVDDDDAFVSKLDSGLASLLASTYLGGVSSDYGNALAIDTSGNVYVTGVTRSRSFPVTNKALDASFNGGFYDAFVSKLNSGLTSLLASTYMGGSNRDDGTAITIDRSGNVYVTGVTRSSDFPVTNGTYKASFNGGFYDAFISKLNSGLTSLLASTYLGGSNRDDGNAITLDASGNVYVTGLTRSVNFPATNGAYSASFKGGDSDVFISKLNGGLTGMLASTYLGGSGGDVGNAIALDASGNVYVTGSTQSTNFPTTSGAYNTSFNGGFYDAIVSKLDGNLSSGLSCTYSLSPTSQTFSYGGGTGSVGVTASSGSCSWTAVGNAAWITVTSGGSGTGNGAVSYSVSANTDTSDRTGTMTIAGQVFTITQSGVPCTYSLSSTSQVFNSTGGSDNVNVKASSNNCIWTVVSNAAWIAVTSGGSGTGNGKVTYSVSANTGTSVRTGTMTIAGQTFTVTQSGISCTYSLSSTSQSFGSGGGTGSVGVTASSGSCSWTAVSNAAWITVTSGGSGAGNGTVAYSVSANTGNQRQDTITIAGQSFTIKQTKH